ncbi:hypothetical protein I302_108939 [Kwoniella bestiolae CBS 10118]|uniref:tRNA (uracil-O(2)-)-methyltransferase n=1 Tax=Kwoniella bestiolae CBS 10118 TaxID=1296100 RepID=A0A1B9FUI9_9TREE|nr:hypothetical protein I302_08080 [Kwoniella bestiolae CBS 10118]OCF22432.1 hypothetical protein I302_08080 [Kwoniella bestiolae CBS 10118]
MAGLPSPFTPGGIKPPPFSPTPYPPSSTSPLTNSNENWVPVLSSKCYFGLSVFLSTLKTISFHPERNSSLILRADTIPSFSAQSNDHGRIGDFAGKDEGSELELVDILNVKLLPRQPRRDSPIDQTIQFYRTNEDGHGHQTIHGTGQGKGKEKEVQVDNDIVKQEAGLVVIIPQVEGLEEIPYYHPKVRKLAYLWETLPPRRDTENGEKGVVGEGSEVKDLEGDVKGIMSIHYLPIDDPPAACRDMVNETQIQGLSLNGQSNPSLLPSPRPLKPRRRSPLAGPSSDGEPIKPPATILSDESELPTSRNVRTPTPEGKERLYRTCLALLETLHKHGYGQLVGYQKRRVHDVIVPRDNFQDLYLTLKDRHRTLDSRAPRGAGLITKLEDVKRHVWKGVPAPPDDPSLPTRVDLSEWGEQDIAIAAFLMLLWKDMYPPVHPGRTQDGLQEEEREWDSWGRPEGGFIDLGCGNGLLVHILISEGYHGKGYELRTRRTWPTYPLKTQEALVELPIDPPSWFPDTVEEWESGSWAGEGKSIIAENTFLIGNHADELTPWLPLLSLLPSTPVPHLSLPCCFHALDSAFTILQFTAPDHPHTPKGGFENGLEPGVSRYQSYLVWLGWVGLKCGWEWEKEGLRVPSTKGWGIVARKRWTTSNEDRECREWALEQVNEVRRNGMFKVREKEGKEH